jgi:DNA repair protein SbcD/Mre11
MRLLHTADWHLGRSLGGHPLQADQEHLLLGQFLDMAREARPDAVLIAGDVFDRTVPPAEAVELLDEVLHRLIRGLGVPVVMIPGNHDEARRLSFAARLLADGGLHIADSPLGRAWPFRDAHGVVTVAAAGYASPLMLAQKLSRQTVADQDASFALLAPRLHALCPEGGRKVLVAHAFVAGGDEAGSERALSVGGSGQIAAARFDGFDYVALGHLHRPQALVGGRLRYAGSPLAYSVSEAGHQKSVALVELDGTGEARCKELPLTPRHSLRLVEGGFAELLAAPPDGREDYVALALTDPQPIPDAQRRLAEIFPRIVSLRWVAEAPIASTVAAPDAAARALRPLDLFEAFHQAMRNKPLPLSARPVVTAAIAVAEQAEA